MLRHVAAFAAVWAAWTALKLVPPSENGPRTEKMAYGRVNASVIPQPRPLARWLAECTPRYERQ
jgi:hypothetical protein